MIHDSHIKMPILALAIASALSCCAQSLPNPPTTVTEQFQISVSGAERGCLGLAQAMPADRFAFVPAKGAFKGVRNFTQLAKHIAAENYVSGAALLGEKPPVDPGPRKNGPDSIQTKAEVLKFMAESFAYLRRAMATVNEKNLMERVDYPGSGGVSRLAVVTAALAHPMDIYGQMIEYLRMSGIDPQALH